MAISPAGLNCIHPSKNRPRQREVPAVVVSRLSLYLRELQHLVRAGQETTNSSQLGTRWDSVTPKFGKISRILGILAIQALVTDAMS